MASVTVAAAGGPRELAASAVVYAPGGFESGALDVDSHGAVSYTHLDVYKRQVVSRPFLLATASVPVFISMKQPVP